MYTWPAQLNCFAHSCLPCHCFCYSCLCRNINKIFLELRHPTPETFNKEFLLTIIVNFDCSCPYTSSAVCSHKRLYNHLHHGGSKPGFRQQLCPLCHFGFRTAKNNTQAHNGAFRNTQQRFNTRGGRNMAGKLPVRHGSNGMGFPLALQFLPIHTPNVHDICPAVAHFFYNVWKRRRWLWDWCVSWWFHVCL